jgi:hypothetical protein
VNTSMRNVALARASRSFPAANVDVGVLAFSALMLPRNVLFTIYHSRKTKNFAADAQSALCGKEPDQSIKLAITKIERAEMPIKVPRKMFFDQINSCDHSVYKRGNRLLISGGIWPPSLFLTLLFEELSFEIRPKF